MDSLKESLANKFVWEPNLKVTTSKKLILILFKNEVEIHICKVLFLCSNNNTAGIRCHETSLEFMLNLKTGKIMSSFFDTKYLVLLPILNIDSNFNSIINKYHYSCEILVKDILDFIKLHDSKILVSPFNFRYHEF